MTEGLPALLADELDSYGRAIEERNIARDAAVCLEQELTAANAAVAAAVELLNERTCNCCTCDDCIGAVCNSCRALVTLGGAL